jgi:subtilisin family serine protease
VTLRRAALRPLLCLLVLLALHPGSRAASPEPGATDTQQILVMLRLAPAHYRPEAAYGGGYDVRLGHDARRRTAAALASAYGLTLRSDWPMPALGVECYVMEVAPLESVAAKLDALSHDPRTEWAQPMNVFRSRGHGDGHSDPLFALQPAASAWHLAELHRLTTGRGVPIAQLDSGVETTHPDLVGQVIAAENFVDGGVYEAEFHGTAVAGIIAARADNGIGIAGVAPEAKLMALRACWQVGADESMCNSLTLAKAMQFALDRRAQVINLSVSGPRDRLLQRLLEVAGRRGITVVAAVDPDAPDGGFPASQPGVLAVGQQESALPPAGADVLAPGTDVPVTEPGARWGLVSGSSFAAAHVSGLVALLNQLAPSLGPRQVVEALSAGTALPTGAGRARIGRIDACAAIARVAGTCACACSNAGGPAPVSAR